MKIQSLDPHVVQNLCDFLPLWNRKGGFGGIVLVTLFHAITLKGLQASKSTIKVS